MDTLAFFSSGGLFETDQKIIDEVEKKKKEEYHNNAKIKKIFELCETDKVRQQLAARRADPCKISSPLS